MRRHCEQTKTEDVASICRKVSERYRTLDGYRVEGSYEVTGKADSGATIHSTAKFVIQAAEKTRKLHVEFKNFEAPLTLITDGSTTWTYQPKDKVYTKVEAATDTSDEKDASGGQQSGESDSNAALVIYDFSVKDFLGFERFAGNTVMSGEQEVKTSGGKVRCWMLETTFPDHRQRVWVDERQDLVWRLESDFAKVHAAAKVNIKSFELQMPEESEFRFEPGKKDKLVDELHIPGAAIFVGRPAEDFTLKNIDGELVRLKDLRGKVVVLDFWATWCPPCRHELPAINKLAEEMKDQDVVFLGINDEGAGTVRNFNKRNGYTFTTLEDTSRKVHRNYMANAIPSLFIIGRDGVIVKHFVGSREEADLMSAIKEASAR